jgi:flagellar biosynthesis/type III secretory pathway protein FliH
MPLQQISPKSVAANPAYVNPRVRTEQATALPNVNQNAQHTVRAAKTDTVTISQQALQKLASDGDSKARETKERYAEAAREKFRGKA